MGPFYTNVEMSLSLHQYGLFWCGLIIPRTLQQRTYTACGLYYKYFTIVVYDCNDSGQYYKTTITIIIDDPSQF